MGVNDMALMWDVGFLPRVVGLFGLRMDVAAFLHGWRALHCWFVEQEVGSCVSSWPSRTSWRGTGLHIERSPHDEQNACQRFPHFTFKSWSSRSANSTLAAFGSC